MRQQDYIWDGGEAPKLRRRDFLAGLLITLIGWAFVLLCAVVGA